MSGADRINTIPGRVYVGVSVCVLPGDDHDAGLIELRHLLPLRGNATTSLLLIGGHVMSNTRHANNRGSAGTAPGGNVLSGVLLGVGIAAFIDETVFHQLLHWHHFYDKATPAIGLVSDGIFHAVGWFAAVAALFLFADLRRRRTFSTLHG